MSEAKAELASSSAEMQKGDNPAALKHAQKAIALRPEMVSAHSAAAVIADDMCHPSADPGPDMRACNLAIQEYKRVLEMDASHQEAWKSLAYLLWKFDREEAQAYCRKALALNANDPEALAGVAAIDASRSWKEIVTGKVDAALPLEKPLIGFSRCPEIRENSVARVNEGISLLTKALQITSDNGDFMIWLSMLYRTRAEIQCGNPPAYRADMDEARKWNHLGSVSGTSGGDYSLRRYPTASPAVFPEK